MMWLKRPQSCFLRFASNHSQDQLMYRACALGHQNRECLVIFVDHDDMNNCRLIYDIPTINHGCNKTQFTPLEQKLALLSRCDARARYHLGTEVVIALDR